MRNLIRDPVGTAVAVFLGVALGVTLAAPMAPEELGLGIELSGGHVTTILILGTIGLLAVPLGSLLLYLLFQAADR